MTVGQLRTLAEALGVPGSYFLGEMSPVKDPVAFQSLNSLKRFASANNLRFPIYEALWSEYQDSRRQVGFAVKTRDTTARTEEDWGKRYEAFLHRGSQRELDLMP